MRLPKFIFDFINSYFRLFICECKRVEGYLVKTVLTNLCENSIWHNLFPVLIVPVHTNEALSSPKYQLRFNSSRLIPASTRLSIISVSDMAIILPISDIVKFVFIVLFKSKQSSNASKWIFQLQSRLQGQNHEILLTLICPQPDISLIYAFEIIFPIFLCLVISL